MSIRKLTFILGVVMLALAGCQANSSPTPGPVKEQTPLPESVVIPSETPIPQPTPTQPPPRSLVICLGQEPASLYLYGGASRSAWSVLDAVYDGPFDLVSYEPQAVILEKMPSYADGDAYFQPVEVRKGDQVVAVNGDLVSLQAGVQVQPSGCSSSECVLTWDGESSLQMDQVVVSFQMLPGLTWSDGAALTAEDSVYSFQVAADPATPVSKQVIVRTASYTALENTLVQWVGVPGYFPERFDTFFWTPLPQHALGFMSPGELAASELAARYPLGWGPYIIEEWVAGDHIQLRRNPAYFRAVEGLPKFDILVYRFLGEPEDSLLDALLSKECDVIDQSTALEDQLEEIMALQAEGNLAAYVEMGPEFEEIVFGITHASYDDGYSLYYGDRPDFFSDVRTRQAIAHCIDRQGMIDDLLAGLSAVPPVYLPPYHPLYGEDLPTYPYDPELGRQLLNQAGWKDWDGLPDTPLQAVGIPTITDGTFFNIQYFTTEAPLRLEIAERVKESLSACGIEVTVSSMPPEQLYAPGPEGPLFGRNFDLASVSWRAGVIPPCEFYVTDQIPALENNWLTLNTGGYSSTTFDTVCLQSLVARPDQSEAYRQQQVAVQQAFAEELPVLPLYYRLRLSLAQPELCGLELNTTTNSIFWNLEGFDSGENCP